MSSRADRFMIGYFIGPDAVGVYSTAYEVASILLLFSKPVERVIFPEFSRLLSDGDKQNVKFYFERGINVFFFLVIPAIFGLSVVDIQLIQLLTGAGEIKAIAGLVPVLSIGISLWAVDQLYGTILTAGGKTKLLSIGRGIGAFLNVVLNFVLINSFDLLGAAVATLGTYLLTAGFVILTSKRIVHIDIQRIQILKFLIAAVVMYIVIGLVDWYFVVDIIFGAIIYVTLLVITNSLPEGVNSFIKEDLL
jgi:O-antigen/teichoic acid export membrane protein